MAVSFNHDVAIEFVNNMDTFCDQIWSDSTSLYDLSESTTWKDFQSMAFENNIYDMCQELQNTFNQLSIYAETLRNKIQEISK